MTAEDVASNDWDEVYRTKAAGEVSWYELEPTPSLDLVTRAGVPKQAAIIDVGGGRSRFAAMLLERGFSDVTVLDVSATAVAGKPEDAQGIVADVTTWRPERRYDVWHDRAVLHFFVSDAQRDAYRRALLEGTAPGAHLFIATFALKGPERCSGRPVRRYDAAALCEFLGSEFTLKESREHDHATPWGTKQRFHTAWLRRQRP